VTLNRYTPDMLAFLLCLAVPDEATDLLRKVEDKAAAAASLRWKATAEVEHKGDNRVLLIEAAFLTSAGGVLGIAFGSAIGLVIHWISGFPVSLPWWSFAIGIGFSASVGIFFGLYPAIKAARLDPINALRSE